MTENQFGRGTPGAAMFGAPQFVTHPLCALHGPGIVWTYEAPAEMAERERVVLGVHRPERARDGAR